MAKVFSRHKYVCRDESFVTTSIFLSGQKTCFVATKFTLVAAPANDGVGLSAARTVRHPLSGAQLWSGSPADVLNTRAERS